MHTSTLGEHNQQPPSDLTSVILPEDNSDSKISSTSRKAELVDASETSVRSQLDSRWQSFAKEVSSFCSRQAARWQG